ncbi:hypothetical protein ACFVT2_13285 [Streptomyces sp. NPDC058000]|uniref:hypothetical protein n=1 Tax=Streptomyces sp. NPDC058000 TaxID=3346299 RepID=UPI0036F0F2A3
MLAIQLPRFGEPEKSLKVVDVPEPPAPTAGLALIQIEYAPLDHHDLLLAEGIYPVRPELPTAIGNEGVGTVVWAPIRYYSASMASAERPPRSCWTC